MDDQQKIPTTEDTRPREKPSALVRALKITGIILLVILVIAAFWIKNTLYASSFTPTELSQTEQKILESKLAHLSSAAGESASSRDSGSGSVPGRMEPEPYSEKDARREINLTERELNGLIANDPEIAQRVAIDLSDDLVSVKLVVPVDRDVPVLGGKTLKFHMGLVLTYRETGPVVALKGISLGGIPLPNAWLGYLKDKNLITEFGNENGFWKLFSEGVRDIQVRDGQIRITLKE